VSNPDDVLVAAPGGRSTVRFPKGPIELSAADVPAYLASRSPGERDLNRLVRHEALWRSWLEAVARTPGDDAVPGERDSGLGWFVRQLAQARIDAATLPVQVESEPTPGRERYAPVIAQLRDALATAVPFPVGSPGRRLRIRLLDGDGSLRHGVAAASALVRAGGQIDQIGNGRTFGAATTQLLYFDESRRADVDRVAAALGVGEVVKGTDNTATTDLIVTLGRDYAARQSAPATTAAPTGEATGG
jgi:hypothetical protein